MKRPCILFFLLFPFFAKPQQGFVNHYDFDRPGALISDMLLNNDTLVVCGLIFPEEPPFTQGIFLAKLDTLGNVLSVKSHFDSLGRDYVVGGFPSGLIKAQDQSGYVLLGGVFQSATGIAIKTNNEGEEIWLKEYIDSLSLVDHFREIIEVENGYIIGGHKQALDYRLDYFIKKINIEGDEIWEQRYGTGNGQDDLFGDILVLNENEYLVGGNTQPYMIPWQQFQSSIQVFAIDSLGNEKWAWDSEPSLEEIWLRGLDMNSDGNWIYATVRGEFEPDGFQKRQPRVIVRDGDFEIVREIDMEVFGGNNGHSFLDMVPLSDGGYLGVGSIRVYVDTPIIAQSHLRTWMSRMDMDGDTLWERKDLVFPDTLFATQQRLHSAVELPSGSIIAAGYYATTSDTKDWGVLIKVDKNGCVDTVNCSPITSVKETEKKNLPLLAYPNPASSHVGFRLRQPSEGGGTRLVIMDMGGRTVRTFEVPEGVSSMRWNTGVSPSGIYFYQLIADGKALQSGKIILDK